MRRVIIESPFAAPTPRLLHRNRSYLRSCLRDCVLRGESPYASHALLTLRGVLRDTGPEERKLGIACGFAWRSVADATVVYTDLGISGGMELGIANATACGHPIEYRSILWVGC